MIRLATLEDADRLSELEIMLFPENALNEHSIGKELMVGQCWVIGDPIIAYALVRVDSRLSDLLRLGVVPDEQGKGHGKALLQYVIEKTPAELTLDVRRDNERALTLYRNHGFHISTFTEEHFYMRRAARRRPLRG